MARCSFLLLFLMLRGALAIPHIFTRYDPPSPSPWLVGKTMTCTPIVLTFLSDTQGIMAVTSTPCTYNYTYNAATSTINGTWLFGNSTHRPCVSNFNEFGTIKIDIDPSYKATRLHYTSCASSRNFNFTCSLELH